MASQQRRRDSAGAAQPVGGKRMRLPWLTQSPLWADGSMRPLARFAESLWPPHRHYGHFRACMRFTTVVPMDFSCTDKNPGNG